MFTLTSDFTHPAAATAATIGMFDGVHRGHQHLVAQLISLAARHDVRPVVVTFDHHPRTVIGSASGDFGLLCSDEERIALLQQLGDIDVMVVPFTRELSQLSACQFFSRVLYRQLHVSHLLLGYDNQFGSRANNDFDRLPALAATYGTSIHRYESLLIDGTPVSSTRVRRAVANGDMLLADKLMGRPFAIGGTVTHGRKVGTGLGFPTANIVVDDNRLMHPQEGVYAVSARIDYGEKTYYGMANYGAAPTYAIDSPTFEVHLFDYSGDLYDSHLNVTFYRRLRDIQLFDTPQALRHQLLQDKADAISFFGQAQ